MIDLLAEPYDRVTQLNWLYFCGICQLIPLKLWLNTAQGCNHQSICMPQLQPSLPGGVVHWVPEQLNMKAVTGACKYCLNHHMYADDTQMIEQTTIPGIPGTIMKLQSCIEATQEWCKSRRLQLNPAKTELIWFGSKANLKKMADLDLNLYIGADVIKPVSVVRDLGVFLDSELSMRHHINTVVRSCFFHLRRLKSVRRILGAEVTSGLVSAFVTTRLDYCNSVLAGLPQSKIDPLQRVQNAAARLVAGTGTRDHITPVLRSLHWLPIKFRIIYKLCVLMHLVRVGRSPAYLSDMMTSVADLPGRERLRSSSSFQYELPRLKLKFGERSFSFSGPKAWNSLPSNLQELTNTDTFKKLLKTHLFKLAFGELEWLCWCTIGHCRCNWRMKWRNVM